MQEKDLPHFTKRVFDAFHEKEVNHPFFIKIDVGNVSYSVVCDCHDDEELVTELGAFLRRITNLKARISGLRDKTTEGALLLDAPSFDLEIRKLERDLRKELAELRTALFLTLFGFPP